MLTILGVLELVLQTVSMVMAARHLTRRGLPRLTGIDGWIGLGLCFLALELVTVQLLGALKLLYPRNLMFAAWLIYLVTTWRQGGLLRPTRPGAPGEPAPHHRGSAASEVPAGPAALAWLVLPVLLALSAALPLLQQGPMEPDSWRVHLLTPTIWLREARLAMPLLPEADPTPAFLPVGGPAITFWVLATTRSDLPARLIQAPFLLLLLAGCYQGARRLGASPERSGGVAAVAALIPLVQSSVAEPGTGLMVAALAAAAGAGLAGRPDTSRLGSAVLAMGLMASLSPSGFLGALLLAPLWFRAARHLPRLGRRTMLAILAGVLLAGWAPLRNLATTGNPIYPIRLILGSRELLPGLATATAVHQHFRSGGPGLLAFLLGAPGRQALGSAGLLLLLGGLGALLGLPAARRRQEPLDWTSALLLPYLAAVLLILPVRQHHLGLLAPLVLGAIGLAGLLQRFRIPGGAAVGLALIPYVWGGMKARILVGGMAASLVAAYALPVARHLVRRLLRHRVMAGLLLTILAAGLIHGMARGIDLYESRKWEGLPGDLGAVVRRLQAEVPGQGITLAYAGWDRPYPLFGAGLKRRVVHIPRDGSPAEMGLYDWNHLPALPAPESDPIAWSRRILAENVSFLVLQASPRGGLPPERSWAEEVPWLRPLRRTGRVRLYRVEFDPEE